MKGEAFAVAHHFDGCGWQYIDNGSGSDWLERGQKHDDAVVLVDHADFLAVLAERDDYADQLEALVPALNREAVEQRARAEAAEAEVARLSIPPDDANVAEFVGLLRDAGDHASFAPSLHHQAADALTRLSHAHAALRKALHIATGDLLEAHAARRKE